MKVFTEIGQMQLGQRVRVTRVKDLIAYRNNDKSQVVVIEPAGTVYEGVVDDIYELEDSFGILLEGGRRWGFYFPSETLQVSLIS
ncbi:MAG: hypothetical protein BroJett011_61030 [Chloroflexota bacterium]|nr:MAG: hypothetical protein BroJett011_61030 [Chloroflexota bacterium]